MERLYAEQQGIAAWRAAGGSGVSVAEVHARAGETVHVGCLGLGVTVEEPGPVIEVVNRDKEYVRRSRPSKGLGHGSDKQDSGES